MKRSASAIVLILVTTLVTFYVVRTSRESVTTLYVNGIVYSLDPNLTMGQAIAVRGSKVAGVGSTEDMTRRFHPQTVVDLRGKTVVPGLIDGHGHLFSEGAALHNLNLLGTTSVQQIADLVAERARAAREGAWIVGRGWDQNRWETRSFPTREALDPVSAGHPVLLTRVDGHAVWANGIALSAAGIDSRTPDPPGGRIIKDSKGAPTGVLIDNAVDIVAAVVPVLNDSEVEERLKLVLQECAEDGLTEVHDMGVDLQTIRVLKKLIDGGECPIRVYAMIGGIGKTWREYLKNGPEIGYGGGMLTVRGIKMYMDGALGSRGAALVDSYSDDPGNRGLTLTSEGSLDSICRDALARGFQVATHAIGDRGNDIVLNTYERILGSLPRSSPSPRWRVEHAQVLLPDDIPRFAAHGILPSMQPTHATSDMLWAESRLGPERIKGAYAWRSILQTGSIIIGGSDFPVESVRPLWGFYAAVTRRDHAGYPRDGWYGQQKMTRLEALQAFTSWAAYGAFEENTKGTLEPGKLADMTILSGDIMTMAADSILSTTVEETILGGRTVFKRTISTEGN